jgi:hypothetical protein
VSFGFLYNISFIFSEKILFILNDLYSNGFPIYFSKSIEFRQGKNEKFDGFLEEISFANNKWNADIQAATEIFYALTYLNGKQYWELEKVFIEFCEKKQMKDIQICYQQNWQSKHLKAIRTCYKRSPFYDYYDPSLYELLNNQHQYLVELNVTLINWLEKVLKTRFNISKTMDIIPYADPNFRDVRDKFNTHESAQNIVNQVYPQVFMDKIDFIPNASILDLLFCMGPTANIYLKDSDL